MDKEAKEGRGVVKTKENAHIARFERTLRLAGANTLDAAMKNNARGTQRNANENRLKKRIGDCVREGRALLESARVVPGDLFETGRYTRMGREICRGPNRRVIDFEKFVEWQATCARVVGDPRFSDKSPHILETLTRLPCSPKTIQWTIGTLRSLKRELDEG